MTPAEATKLAVNLIGHTYSGPSVEDCLAEQVADLADALLSAYQAGRMNAFEEAARAVSCALNDCFKKAERAKGEG